MWHEILRSTKLNILHFFLFLFSQFYLYNSILCSEWPVQCGRCVRENACLSTLMHTVILVEYLDTTKHKSILFQFFYFDSLHFTQSWDTRGGPMEKSNGVSSLLSLFLFSYPLKCHSACISMPAVISICTAACIFPTEPLELSAPW
jgi:hypothetical protein